MKNNSRPDIRKRPHFRVLAALTLFFFVFSTFGPNLAIAFDNSPWYSGGQAVDVNGTDLDGKPGGELAPDPANNPACHSDPVLLNTGEETFGW